jgi:hypothetical protein
MHYTLEGAMKVVFRAVLAATLLSLSLIPVVSRAEPAIVCGSAHEYFDSNGDRWSCMECYDEQGYEYGNCYPLE